MKNARRSESLLLFDVKQARGELPSHSHSHARIALTLEGNVIEHSAGRVDAFRKGDVVFWREGATHRDIFMRRTRSLQVELSHDIYRHVADYFPPSPSPIASDRFEGAAQRLLREAERRDDASPMAVQAAVYEMLARAMRLVCGASPVSFAVNQAIRFAREHYADPLTLGELAGAANVSVRRLHERFTAELRQTPMDYLRDLRLARAETLLRESTLSSSEIAESCGFYDHAHFCRLFKRKTGLTPSAFRRKE